MGRWDNQDQTISLPKKTFQRMLLACGVAGSLISLGIIAFTNGVYLLFHC